MTTRTGSRCAKQLDILLVTPAHFETYGMSISCPALVAHLEQAGFHAEHLDINSALEAFLERGTTIEQPGRGGPLPKNIINYKFLLELFSASLPKAGYYGFGLSDSFSKAELFNPSPIAYANLACRDFPKFIEMMNDPLHNVFHHFYEAEILGKISQLSPGAVGISVTSPAQLLSAFTLAKMLRDTEPELPLIFGGAFITRYGEEVAGEPHLQALWDFIILGEGESALAALLQVLEDGQDDDALEAVPNLIFKSAGDATPVMPKTIAFEDVNALAPPALAREDMVFPVLCYESARSCYWRKCKFCVHTVQSKHRPKSAQKVVDDLVAMQERFGVRQFRFTDLSHSPRQMRLISEELLSRKVDVELSTYARLDKNFTRETLELAAEAGYKHLEFGLETANARLAELVTKGYHDLASIDRILEDANRFGIQSTVHAMFGLPTETEEETLETYYYLLDRATLCHPSIEVFRLEKHIPIWQEPEKYQIRIHWDPDREIFNNAIAFEQLRPDAISIDRALALRQRFYRDFGRAQQKAMSSQPKGTSQGAPRPDRPPQVVQARFTYGDGVDIEKKLLLLNQKVASSDEEYGYFVRALDNRSPGGSPA